MRRFIVLYEYENKDGEVLDEMFAVRAHSPQEAALLPLEELDLKYEKLYGVKSRLPWHARVYETDRNVGTFRLVLSDYVKNLERGE